jgi:hypothetical protein
MTLGSPEEGLLISYSTVQRDGSIITKLDTVLMDTLNV